MSAPAIRTCLWFDTQAEEAMRLYVSLFEDAKIESIFRQGAEPDAPAFVVHWTMMGQSFSAINGGDSYKLSPASSIEVHVETQEEVDRLWDTLMEGGTAMRCGWLTDRYRVSWQIIPRALMRLTQGTSPEQAQRVFQAMMGMVKLDIEGLEAAAKT